MNIRKLAVLSAILIACGACSKNQQKSGAEKSVGLVVAEVNGTKITADEFQKELTNLPPQYQVIGDTPEGRKDLLDTIIVRQIVLQEARKEGVDKSSAVAEKLEELKDKVVVEAFLKKRLDEQVKIPDEELRKVYEQYKDKFKTGEQVKASHILVKTEKEAQDLAERLKKGENFEELAKKFSTDPAAAKGGDLGWFGKEAMLPEFEKVAFGLKEGAVSAPVKTKFGFHIIKVTGKRGPGVLPFEEVKDQIKTAVLPQKQQEYFAKLKDDLKKGAKITINEEALKKVSAAPSAAPPASGK